MRVIHVIKYDEKQSIASVVISLLSRASPVQTIFKNSLQIRKFGVERWHEHLYHPFHSLITGTINQHDPESPLLVFG
jgi:hypothetical protein